jgi:hypothetical protein
MKTLVSLSRKIVREAIAAEQGLPTT